MNPYTPQQIDQLRQALAAIGLIQTTATDDQVMAAFTTYQTTNPSGAATILQQAGLSSTGLFGIPWLVILGVGGGLVAMYVIWSMNSSKGKQVDAYEYPEPDTKHQLRAMSKSMRPLSGMGRARLGCKPLGRLGAASTHKKYEFEPEIRLEGLRRKRARR